MNAIDAENARATAVVLFDGMCNLCDGTVRFLIARDRHARLRFASLQSETAGELLGGRDRPDLGIAGSIILVEGDRIFDRSDAVLQIATLLGPPWSFARVVSPIPRAWRDAVYRAIARNRYRVFGRRATCRIATPSERERFL